jgi:hypothetical protein
MNPPDPLQALHDAHARLSLRGTRSLTGDEEMSLRYYRTDLAVLHDPQAFAGSRKAVVLWILLIHRLDTFVAHEDRHPRQNNRDRGAISAEEWRLAGWLVDERAAIRSGSRCSYQAERLMCVPGFSVHPLEDLWDTQFNRYRRFMDEHAREPLEGSDDTDEDSAASWAAKQRMYHRAGTLPERRVRVLSGYRGWTWTRGR